MRPRPPPLISMIWSSSMDAPRSVTAAAADREEPGPPSVVETEPAAPEAAAAASPHRAATQVSATEAQAGDSAAAVALPASAGMAATMGAAEVQPTPVPKAAAAPEALA